MNKVKTGTVDGNCERTPRIGRPTLKDDQRVKMKIEKLENPLGSSEGYVVYQLNAYVKGHHAGYLRVAFIPEEKWNRLYPDVIHYKTIMGGMITPISEKNRNRTKKFISWNNLNKEEKKETLMKLYQHIKFTPRPEEEFSEENPGEDELEEHYKELLKLFNKKYGEEYKQSKQFLTKPYVDFIRVFDFFQRKGLATLMYLRMAIFLAKKGYNLYESDLQSEEAQMAWSKLENKGLADKGENGRRFVKI